MIVLEPRLVKSETHVRYDAATGAGVRQVRIVYMVGHHGPFETFLAEESFTAANVRQVMQARATELSQL